MTDLSTFGKWIFFSGLAIAAIGLIIWAAGKAGLPLGHLLGDVRVERPGFSFQFHIVTSIVISIVLTIILNILIRFFRR